MIIRVNNNDYHSYLYNGFLICVEETSFGKKKLLGVIKQFSRTSYAIFLQQPCSNKKTLPSDLGKKREAGWTGLKSLVHQVERVRLLPEIDLLHLIFA